MANGKDPGTETTMMTITIPANSDLGAAFVPIFQWLSANAVDPTDIDATNPVMITDSEISAVTKYGRITAPVRTPMPGDLVDLLIAAGWPPVAEPLDTVDLSPMAVLVQQLAEARAAKKAATEREEEARDQILSLMSQHNAKYGNVNGRPAVRRNVIEKSQFQTVKFRNAHPELASEFTTMRTETRLELL